MVFQNGNFAFGVGVGVGVGVVGFTVLQSSLRKLIQTLFSKKSLEDEVSVETRVYLVGAGPGCADLITVRGLRLVREADVIVHDRLIPVDLLDKAKFGAKIINVGKAPNKVRFKQVDINRILVEEARKAARGSLIVRLKGGDPFVFGLGGDEVIALQNANISCEIVPGITSSIAVPACVGIPVTQKIIATSFTVISGHYAPGTQGAADWDNLPKRNSTLVVLMGARNVNSICSYLVESNGWSDSTPVAFIQSGTTVEEKVVTTTLAKAQHEAEKMQLKSPCVIVIGQVCSVLPRLNYRKKVNNKTSVWGNARDPL
uniref:uroporphyrinogen-III C-methyltransferase n=1 Tax=Aplanochytrium stocchinoi TaxID=215587 RepID=A0A7S3LQU6_9STRA